MVGHGYTSPDPRGEMSSNDYLCLEICQKGLNIQFFDQAAFESVFRSHFQYLCNYAKQYVGDQEISRDITQKVFINLWEKRAEIDPQMSVKSWLFTSVRNRCLNYIRDHKKYQSEVLDIDCGDFDLSVEDHHFAEEELAAKIHAALETLPDKCRQVFELSRFEEKKYKEIAIELDISQKNRRSSYVQSNKNPAETSQGLPGDSDFSNGVWINYRFRFSISY